MRKFRFEKKMKRMIPSNYTNVSASDTEHTKTIDLTIDRDTNEENSTRDTNEQNFDLKSKEEKLKDPIGLFPQNNNNLVESFIANCDIKVKNEKFEENHKRLSTKIEISKGKKCKTENVTALHTNITASDTKYTKTVDVTVDRDSNEENCTKGLSIWEQNFDLKVKEEKLKDPIDLFPQNYNNFVKDEPVITNCDIKVATEKFEENNKRPAAKTELSKRKKFKTHNNDEDKNTDKNDSNKFNAKNLRFFESDDSDVEILFEDLSSKNEKVSKFTKNADSTELSSLHQCKKFVNYTVDTNNNGRKSANCSSDLEYNSHLKVKEEKIKYLTNLFPQIDNEYLEDVLSIANWDIKVAKEKFEENRKKPSVVTKFSKRIKYKACNNNENENTGKDDSGRLKKCKELKSELEDVSMENKEPIELLHESHECKKSLDRNVDSNTNGKNPVNSTSDLEHNFDMKYKQAIIKYLTDLFLHIDNKYIEDALLTANLDIKIAKDKLEENAKTNFDNKRDSEKGTLKKRKVVTSNDDSDVISHFTIDDKKTILEFMENALPTELSLLHQCSQKKVDEIIEVRPFKNWKNLVSKLQKIKFLDALEVLDEVWDLIKTRKAVDNLMKKCLCLSERVETAITAGSATIKEQPKSLSSKFTLSAYQMVGLNWLAVMHAENVNGILADEMGLGKTVQVIAFLTYLKEAGLIDKKDGPHLIVVPSSTLENWGNELKRWSPGLRVVQYYGSQDERKKMRIGWRKGGLNGVEVILTTYNFVSCSSIKRQFFRKLPMKYVIFDEAHMLKNMCTLRYKNLIKINANRRILLTGTPLQNNLLELMSLLNFTMPSMFVKERKKITNFFSKNPKVSEEKSSENKPMFEEEQIKNAKLVIKPFLLRRLKADVLNDLPKKMTEVIMCPMLEKQKENYTNLLSQFSTQSYHYGMIMPLRKLANHPLLFRSYYDEEKLKNISKRLISESAWKVKDSQYTYDALLEMTDFKIFQLSRTYKSLAGFGLPLKLIPESGKLKKLDELLPDLKENDHRVLIFSQFTMVLDILEEYLTIRGHKYLRLDGSTPVLERQNLIDQFTEDSDIFVFLLSTRAGGLGINLTSADTVIIHDIDLNPYNDKQAEDRCHRVGQKKPVRIIRLLSNGTVEEHMYKLTQEKLELEQKITGNKGISESTEKKDELTIMKMVLDGNKSLILSPNRNKEGEGG